MVKFIKRDNNDLFKSSVWGFLFKNRKFLTVLRVSVAVLFFYAIFYGIGHPGKENIFTGAVFWGIFWALFMVATLPTFGRIFCGICPHGYLGKYITRFGLKKAMPKFLQNRYIGILILLIGWWGIYYTFPGFWKSPLNTALMFGGMTVAAFVLYFLFKDMSYCKSICPIGTMTRAYDKLAFTKLETYKSACTECRTFECATACPYNLKPFTFEKKNQTDDCTLCMECTHACEAVKFKYTAPAKRLYGRFKGMGAEIWTYILILAAIPVTMTFAHGLDRSKIADQMIWNKTAAALGIPEYSGGIAFFYALVMTSLFAVLGLWLASKALKKGFKSTFTDLGYAYAPLFILGSLGHTLESFFTRGSKTIVEGFAQGFGFVTEAAPLASRGDGWLVYFGVLKWLGIVWALIILYKRLKQIESTRLRKILAYIFASLLIVFFIGVNMYRGYVFSTYGAKGGGHSGHGAHAHKMHGGGKMFQSVPASEATIVQTGKDKTSCSVCGMTLPMFYRTNHAAKVHGHDKQYCSIHCLTEELAVKKRPLEDIRVVDAKSLKFIPVDKAFYVVGSGKKGTMSMVSKYAFANRAEAESFAKRYGGKIANFQEAKAVALRDFTGKPSVRRPVKTLSKNDTVYFSLTDPTAKGAMGGHSHGGDRPGVVPTKKVWLLFGTGLGQQHCLTERDGALAGADWDKQPFELKKAKGKCPAYTFELPKNGYYNLYFTKELREGGAHYIKTAKLEYLRGSHGSEDVYDPKKMTPFISDNPIDIIRLRDKEEESFFHKFSTGDLLRFKVLVDGKAAVGSEVTIHMGSGWVKKVMTDENGMVTFRIIKDYFPDEWSAFDKGHKGDILIVATYKTGSKAYEITYPLSFYPGESEYKSYAYSLIFITLTMLLASWIIYRYRRNRTRPFQELKHEE